MTRLSEVEHLGRHGRYAEAQELLQQLDLPKGDRIRADVLRMALLERTGEYERARQIAKSLANSGRLNASWRSLCEQVLGIVAWDAGQTDEGLNHLQRSVALAKSSGDLERLCWAQLRFLMLVSARSDPQNVVPLLGHTRSLALRLGDCVFTAALHIFSAELEAKRGLIDTALRHNRAGLGLLERAPNPWLGSIAENNYVAIALMQSDFNIGITHALRAHQLAVSSGAAAMTRACLGNLGNLYCLVGEYDKAIDHLQQAVELLPSSGEYGNCPLDSLARTHLLMGRFGEASQCLDRIEQTVRSPRDWVLYANRYSQLTRSALFCRAGQLDSSLKVAERAISLARGAEDHFLEFLANIQKLEALGRLHRVNDVIQSMKSLGRQLPNVPIGTFAQYEAILAIVLALVDRRCEAFRHFERASQIYCSLGNKAGSSDLTRAWNELNVVSQSLDAEPSASVSRTTIQDIALLTRAVERPDLTAKAIFSMLTRADIVGEARVEYSDDETGTRIEAEYKDDHSLSGRLQLLEIGRTSDRQAVIRLRLRSDPESLATFNAITLIIKCAQEMQQARVEREERMTLWPIEELPLDGGQAIIRGQLRDIMAAAQKVASTNVTVLITGESGTGKEVLARAIHAYSRRAQKLFVPFNCTAVPRDLLESQLFGYRRGAFTGADRDYPGLIRSAAGGTLFLDEIGELSLDLQPKLLRFLESSEIAPLGEPGTHTVDVRVIASTNANLEQLTQEGRFREDLLYRLNVIEFTMPPLRDRRDEIPELVHHFAADAAKEFDKGSIRVAEETMEHLMLYEWPGNIRQLQNEIRRMVALADPDSTLPPSMVSSVIRQALGSGTHMSRRDSTGNELILPLVDRLAPTISRVERAMIGAALRTHPGNLDAAARSLGISRKGLYLKRIRLGL